MTGYDFNMIIRKMNDLDSKMKSISSEIEKTEGLQLELLNKQRGLMDKMLQSLKMEFDKAKKDYPDEYALINRPFTLMFGENIQEPDQIYEYSLEKLFSFMRYSEKLEWLIEDIRAAHKAGDEDLKKVLKKQLQYVTTSHLKVPKRHKDNFLCSNGFIFDADHLVDVNKMAEILKTNKYVHFMFLSPSGDGLKIGVKTSVMVDNADWYSSAYRYCSQQITKTYGITLDKTSDCVRACFLSHDDDIYYNPNSALWFPKILKEQPKPEYKPIIMSEVDEISRCIDAARSITVSDYQEWVTCMFALKNTFGEAGFDVFRALSFGKGYKDNENDLQCKWRTIPGDSQVNIGSFWHIAKKYGYSYK